MFSGSEGQRSIVLLLLAWATTGLIIGVESKKCLKSDSVDLTNLAQHANGSYSYDGLLIPPEWIENFKSEINGTVKQEQRACICEVRPCVSLCCANPRARLNSTSNKCEEHEMYANTPKINITFEDANGRLVFKHNFDDFFPLRRNPCQGIFQEKTNWYLLKNGSVNDNGGILEREHYCLHGGSSDTSSEIAYTLYSCFYPNIPEPFVNVLQWTKFISAICMIIAAVTYLVAGRKTANQNLFICYYITLSITFLSMNIDFFTYIPTEYCVASGFLTYFSLMAAFCTLTVISVSMWNKFRGFNFYAPHSKSKKRFLVHYLFAFGGASLITLCTALAHVLPMNDEWKPGMGYQTCWVSTNIYLYLYGPLCVFISINTVMFIFTTKRIFKLRKEANFAKASNKKLRAGPKKFRFSNEFKLYLRIFFTMGILWIFEIILKPIGAPVWIENVADFLNAAQGIILLIISPNILQLIYERFILRKKPVACNLSCPSASGLCADQRLQHDYISHD